MFTLLHPTEIHFGRNTFDKLGDCALRLTDGKGGLALLVTGKSAMKEAGVTARAEALIEKAGMKAAVFDGVSHDPTLDTVQACMDFAVEQGADVIIGIGGGSPIDAAKAVAIMMTQEAGLRACFDGSAKITAKGLPFIAVPTTAGTGAEVTKNSVLSDTAAGVKKSLRDDRMVPDVAICDPLLTVSAPRNVTANSGMDALTQALECTITRAANPFSDAISQAAARRLHAALPRVVDELDNLGLRDEMLLGSVMAGVAFGNASLGAVHGLAHPIAVATGQEHGLLCGVLLPEVMELNIDAEHRDATGRTTRERIAHVAAHLGYESPEAMVAGLRELRAKVGLPAALGELGLEASQFDMIIANCRSGSMTNNPREMTDADIRDLLARMAR